MCMFQLFQIAGMISKMKKMVQMVYCMKQMIKNGSIKATADNEDTEEHVMESEMQQKQQISGEKIM